MTIIIEKRSFKGMTGSWTKYGGRRYSVIENQKTLRNEEWACQSCALIFPAVITPYKYEYPEGQYLNVCAVCFAEDCIRLMNRIVQEEFWFDNES